MLRSAPRVSAAMLAAALSGLLLLIGAGAASATSVRSVSTAASDVGQPVERGLVPVKAPLHKADIAARGQHDQSGVGPDLPAVVPTVDAGAAGWRSHSFRTGAPVVDDHLHSRVAARAPPR